MNIPEKIIKGLTYEWTDSLEDYPATTYTLYYNLVNSTANVTITSTADGADHDTTLSATTTAGYTAGTYRWTSYVVSGSTKYLIEQGWTVIEANPLSGNTDFRSHARKTLDLINTAIESMMTNGQAQAVDIAGRTVTYRTMEDLLKAKAHYEYLVKQEELEDKINAGREAGNKILVRF